MALEILIKEFDPVRLICGSSYGKLILVPESNVSNSTLSCYALPDIKVPGVPFTHADLAAVYDIPSDLPLGGLRIERRQSGNQYLLRFEGGSQEYRGVPKVVVSMLLDSLRSHLIGFDYPSAELKFQREEHQRKVIEWESEVERLISANEEPVRILNDKLRGEYEERCAEIIAQRKKEEGSWINKRLSQLQGLSVGAYLDKVKGPLIIPTYPEAHPPALLPSDLPPEPQFAFTPRNITAEQIVLVAGPIAGVLDRKPRWEELLGYKL